jgi:hypothetical protein
LKGKLKEHYKYLNSYNTGYSQKTFQKQSKEKSPDKSLDKKRKPSSLSPGKKPKGHVENRKS